ncbi:hypothetical protein ACTA71_008212 [Dictyostelium dimigraforme]
MFHRFVVLFIFIIFIYNIFADDSKIPKIITSKLLGNGSYINSPSSCTQRVYELVEKNGYEIISTTDCSIVTENSTHSLLLVRYYSNIDTTGIYSDLILNKGFGNETTLKSLLPIDCSRPPNPLQTNINGKKFIYSYNSGVGSSMDFKIFGLTKDIPSISCQSIEGPFFCIFSVIDSENYIFKITLFHDIDSRSNSTIFKFSLVDALSQSTTISLNVLSDYHYVTDSSDIVDFQLYPKPHTGSEYITTSSIIKTVGSFSSKRSNIMSSISSMVFFVYNFDGNSYNYISKFSSSSNSPSITIGFGVFGNLEPRYVTQKRLPQSLPTCIGESVQFFMIDDVVNSSMVEFQCQASLVTSTTYINVISFFPNQIYFSSPYGIGSGTEKDYKFKLSTLVPEYLTIINPAYLLSTRTTFPSAIPPKHNGLPIDRKPPSIESVEYIQLPNSIIVIRIHIKDDISGFKQMIIGNTIIRISDLVSGDLNDGYYETQMVIRTFSQLSLQLFDRAGNEFNPNSESSNPYIGMNYPFPSEPSLISTFLEITTFYFDKNDIDLSSFGSVVTVYVNYENSSPEQVPFFLVLLAGESISNIPIWNYPMSWDSNKRIFKRKFYLPPRLNSGIIEYQLLIPPLTIGRETMYSKFGDAALLRVFSTLSDEIPPIVSKAYFNVQSLTLNSKDSVIIKLHLEIDDPINGLKNGSVSIGSDFDSINGYNFQFDPTSAINRSPYYGIYEFQFQLTGNCRSQSFSIKSMELIDRSDHFSSTINDYSISPLFKINDLPTLNVTCNNPLDTIPPFIHSLTLSRSSIGINSTNRGIIVDLIINDTDSGVSQKHLPFIYFDDSQYNQFIGRPIIIQEKTTLNSVHFRLTTTLPYKMGADTGTFISVYGIYDNHLNINGYSSSDLLNVNIQSIIETQLPQTPILESYSSVLMSGSSFFIYGNRLGTDSSTVIVMIDLLDGNGYKIHPHESRLGSAIKVAFVTPYLNEKSFFIKVIVDGSQSNELLIIPIPFLESPNSEESLKNYCEGTCGYPERGYCPTDQSGCICNSPFSGKSCSEVSSGTEIKPGEKPDILSNHTASGGETFFYSIEILELIEYNLIGNPINRIKFDRWTFNNLTTSDLTQYVYSTNFTHNSILTNINVFIKYFKNRDKVFFANRLLDMAEGTIKYQVEMSSYQFSSRVNSLSLVMRTTIKSDHENRCIVKDQGNSSISSDFVQIQVNGVSIYGKLIKLAIIDQKIQQVSNTISQTLEGYNELTTGSFIQINLPYYSKSVSLDPDFSVLLNPDARDKCTEDSNTNSGLTKSQLAGIIVSSVFAGCVLILIISFTLYKKFKYSTIIMNIKEFKRVRLMKKQQIEVSMS